LGKFKETNQLEDPVVYGITILKWILESAGYDMDWTHLAL
jgi:hypothetical protein